MMTIPCTRADWATVGYTGLTSCVFVGCWILPPGRRGSCGGGGVGAGRAGGVGLGSPNTGPSLGPTSMQPVHVETGGSAVGGSGLIRVGGSSGGPGSPVVGFGVLVLGSAGPGGGGGGGRLMSTGIHDIASAGVGSAPTAMSGIMIAAMIPMRWSRMDTGRRYFFLPLPTCTDDWTMSPKISLTASLLSFLHSLVGEYM